MRITYLIWDYWPGLQGGAERQARLVSQEMTRRGLFVIVVTARHNYAWKSAESDGPVTVRRIGLFIPALLWLKKISGRLPFLLTGARKDSGKAERLKFWFELPWLWLARLEFILIYVVGCRMGRFPADIVHLHEPSWLGGVAQYASRRGKFKVICQEATSPALPTIGYDTPFRQTLDRLRRQTVHIAMADYSRAELLNKRIPADKIFMLPSGVPVPAHSTCGMPGTHVLHIANYSQGAAWKAFDVLYDAWMMVVRERPDAQLNAIGGGDHSFWEKKVEEVGCRKSVNFTGNVPSVDPYFNQSSIFLLPSRVEGMSNALLEAQMWGLACIVSDIPGNLAVVKDGFNGLVVQVGDAKALALAIIRLLNDSELRIRLGKAAREHAVITYGIESIGEQLMAIYKKVQEAA